LNGSFSDTTDWLLMFIAELLAEVLGDEPTDRNLWLATRNGRKGRDLALELLARYNGADLEPLPAKTTTTFRPAFLTDYHGRSWTPYDREFAFVARALNYADQVVVVDEVGTWAASPDPEEHLDSVMLGGFLECDNVTWSLRRIARYAALEHQHLLYYVDAPRREADRSDARGAAELAAAELQPLVEERMGWASSVVGPGNRLGLVADELELWFDQLHTVLAHVERSHQHVDLYLPEWFAGPALLDWTYRAAIPPDWMSSDALKDQRAVSQLLNLPSPTSRLIDRLSSDELLAVREADHMAQWRHSARDGLGRLAQEADLITRVEIYEDLQRHAEQLRRSERQRPTFGEGFTEAIQAGVAVAPIAALAGQNPLVSVLESAAPAVANLARSLVAWMFAADLTTENEVRDHEAEANSMRIFLSVPTSSGDPNAQRPPTSWMRTLDGRPMAFDLFDIFPGHTRLN
jgi:hypothetical protein